MDLGSLKMIVLACSLQVAHPVTAQQAAAWNAQHPTIQVTAAPRVGDSCPAPVWRRRVR